MEYRDITLGVRVPMLGIGTWGMGGYESPNNSADDEAVKAIRTALDLGMTHIDTAEYYGAGHAEELVGRAIRGWDRDDLFITTKVWPSHLRKDQVPASLDMSLKRMGLKRVDLFLVHWPNSEVPLAETMGAMESCIDSGKTRFIGVSNFDSQLMREAEVHLREARLVANQVEYSLAQQGPRKELLATCRKMGICLVAYKPLGRGSLLREANPVLDEIAEAHGVTRVQVALNWLVSQEGVVAIPKSSNPDHLKEIAGSVGWRLTASEFKRLSNAYA